MDYGQATQLLLALDKLTTRIENITKALDRIGDCMVLQPRPYWYSFPVNSETHVSGTITEGKET